MHQIFIFFFTNSPEANESYNLKSCKVLSGKIRADQKANYKSFRKCVNTAREQYKTCKKTIKKSCSHLKPIQFEVESCGRGEKWTNAPTFCREQKEAYCQSDKALRSCAKKIRCSNAKVPKSARTSSQVQYIVLHSIGGPKCNNKTGKVEFSTIKDPSTGKVRNAKFWKRQFLKTKKDIHYIIDKEGRIEKMVDEKYAAKHARSMYCNKRPIGNENSIGIELVNQGDGNDKWDDLTMKKVAETIRSIQERWPNIKKENIVGHSNLEEKQFNCGMKKFKRKVDPGKNFPWEKLWRYIEPIRK